MIYSELAPDHRISRVIKGGWQLAGGHGQVNLGESVADMIAFCDAGITTYDCADIYTGVEEMIGAFRKTYVNERGSEALRAVKVHTKYVPDLQHLAVVSNHDVEASIDTSLRRLKTEQLDLVQFHWWDYDVNRYLEIAGHLTDLRAKGKIANIGGTNFNTAHTRKLIEAGVPLVAMQVQYSLIDTRPAREMVQLAKDKDIGLLCYGSVAGGLISERWLGAKEPTEPLENRSLIKYKLIVDDWGGWSLFQELLNVLSQIAKRHDTDISSVASRAVLNRPSVTAVIVGARNRSHLDRNASVAELNLTNQDYEQIEAVTMRSKTVSGDVFDLERDRNGRHGSIMKYNLNKGTA